MQSGTILQTARLKNMLRQTEPGRGDRRTPLLLLFFRFCALSAPTFDSPTRDFGCSRSPQQLRNKNKKVSYINRYERNKE